MVMRYMQRMAYPGGLYVEKERYFVFWPAPPADTLGGQEIDTELIKLPRNFPEAQN